MPRDKYRGVSWLKKRLKTNRESIKMWSQELCLNLQPGEKANAGVNSKNKGKTTVKTTESLEPYAQLLHTDIRSDARNTTCWLGWLAPCSLARIPVLAKANHAMVFLADDQQGNFFAEANKKSWIHVLLVFRFLQLAEFTSQNHRWSVLPNSRCLNQHKFPALRDDHDTIK